MLQKFKIETIIITVFILFSFNNFINIMINEDLFFQKIIKYVGMILGGIILFLIIIKLFGKKKYIAYSIIFHIFGIVTAWMGDRGNATGLFFLCISLYIFNSEKHNAFIIATIILTLIAKSFVYHYNIFQLSNLLILYSFGLLLFSNIIPSCETKIRNGKIEPTQYDIIEKYLAGYHIEEIEKIELGIPKKRRSKRAIYGHIQKARKNYNCNNDIQLGFVLAQNDIFKV